MPGSTTPPGPRYACDGAQRGVAFHGMERVGTQDKNYFVARWLACAYPCRRFGHVLTGVTARLGANADRYSFIAVDLHHLLHAGLSGAPIGHSRPSARPTLRR